MKTTSLLTAIFVTAALVAGAPHPFAKKGGNPGGGGGGGGGGAPTLSYTVELIPNLGPQQTAVPRGTNDNGDVVGYMYDDSTPFGLGFFNYVDVAGTSRTISLTDLVGPGLTITNPQAINNSRQITGSLVEELPDGTLVGSAFRLSLAVDTVGVTATELIVFRDLTGTSGAGKGINSAGDVAGYSEIPGGGGRDQPFKWTDADATMTLLPVLIENWSTWATAINDAGALAGYTNPYDLAFSHTDAGGYEILPSLRSDNAMVARDISNTGVIVGMGQATRSGGYLAFRNLPGGESENLGDLGGGFSAAYAVSDAGYVVGMSRLKDGKYTGPEAAFIWHESFGMVELGTLVTNLGNLTLEYPNDISTGAGGYICGETKGGQGFILIPN